MGLAPDGRRKVNYFAVPKDIEIKFVHRGVIETPTFTELEAWDEERFKEELNRLDEELAELKRLRQV